jgi:type I restriction enzyme S subunit
MVPIGEAVDKISTWNPSKQPDGEFEYIDLSAVDQDTKHITAANRLASSEAPSRARQLVATGDVLISTVRPNLNGVAKVTEDYDGMTASTGFCVLRPREKLLSSDYLFQWVKSPLFVRDMVRKATGASYPAVSDRIIKDSVIPLPPLDEQQRIAAILDKADQLRQKRRQAIALLDSLTQSIFLEMFGDPVSNPKGWKMATVGDVIFKASDGPHVSPKYCEDGIPFLSTRHISRGGILWRDLKYISEEDAQIHWRKCKPERGDLLYTKGGTTGIAAQVNFDDPFAVWVHVALLKTRHDLVAPKWLECMLNSNYCYQQSQIYTHGIANRDLGLKRMVKIKLYVPPLHEQAAFVDRANTVAHLLHQHEHQRLEADNLFASLQHRAFTGQL